MRKNIILTVLVVCIGISLTACGKKPDEIQMSALEYQSSDYQKLSIIIPNDITAKDFVMTETSVVVLDGSGITRIDYDGVISEEIPLAGSESYTRLSIDGDGNYHILALSQNEAGNIENLSVCQFRSNGSRLGITELIGSFAEEEDAPFMVDFLTVGGYHYVQSLHSVYVYNEAGDEVFSVREEHDTMANSLFLMGDGRVASVATRTRNNTQLLVVRLYEPDASDFEEHVINIAEITPGSLLTNGGRLGFLMVENSGLHEYALETGRGEIMLNFLDHGVNPGGLIGLTLTRDGDIVCVLARGSAWVWQRTAGEIVVFSARQGFITGTMEAHRPGDTAPTGGGDENITEEIVADTGPPKEKETVTMMVMQRSPNIWLNERVALFNKTNPDYNIEVISYPYTDASDEEDARRRFIIDLAHDPADIIYLFSSSWYNSTIPIQSYARKGLFADLYEIMDADPDFNKADYLPNIFKVLEIDGRLYDIFPAFMIDCILGKASDFNEGEKPGWSIDEFISFLDRKSGAEHIIGDYTKKRFISTMIEYYFTDPETGRIVFDREEFLKILKASERFPVTGVFPDDIFVSYDERHAFLAGARDGDPLMLNWTLFGGGSLRAPRSAEVTIFDEAAIFKGFPSAGGSGTQFVAPVRFAISEKSVKKDGAWEFIKFTMEVCQHPSYGGWDLYMPVKTSSIEKMLDETLVNPVSHDGKEYQHYDTIGGNRIIIGNNTPELNRKIMDLIKPTTVVVPSDRVVREIISEEVASYLAGQKTPNQVADIIENRVSLYLKELE